MKIVLDTNVLLSGLLSPYGPPGHIVRMVAAGADYLVTGNLRHIPAPLRHGVRVVSPAQFVQAYPGKTTNE